jgi:hypothetical protein
VPESPISIEDVQSLLGVAPDRIRAMTSNVDPVCLTTPPAPGEWSVNEILAHLRANADVWGKYIGRIIAEEHPTFRAGSPRAWMRQTHYDDLEFNESLSSFAAQRADLLAQLDPLPRDAWLRTAAVRVREKTVERSVLDYATMLADHERGHIDQIAQTIHAVNQ